MTDSSNVMILILQVLVPLMLGTIFFSSTIMSYWRWLVALLLFIGVSTPFIYFLYEEYTIPGAAVQTNLEASILFAWGSSFLLLAIGIIKIFLRIKKY